jgi:tetratricopeptide (TPR) repeat protein
MITGKAREEKGLYSVARKKYEKALSKLLVLAKEDPDDKELTTEIVQARCGILRTARMTGDFEAALAQSDILAGTNNPADARLGALVARGKILFETGRLDETEKVFAALYKERPGFLLSILYLGLVARERGDRDKAFKWLDKFSDIWLDDDFERTSANLTTIALGAIRMMDRYQDMAEDAQRILEEAIEKDENNHQARVALGNLFRRKYVRDRRSFQEVIKRNPYYPDARVGMARYYMLKYDNKKALEEVKRALAVNPGHVEALVCRARIELSDEVYDAPVAHLDRALAVNPRHLTALSLRAAVHYMRGETQAFEALRKKVMGFHPGYGRFYHILAGVVVNRRRLDEAVALERKAVKADPELWIAHIDLGIALSRMGLVEEAKKALEEGFRGDSFHVQARNLLTLFDDYDQFIKRKTENFDMLFHKNDEPVMAHYTGRLLERGWKDLTKRYEFSPKKPVKVEMFRQAQDFATRTIGLPGLGALGACFGPLITLDSPYALPPGKFNWASTVWHEFAHVVTVQLSDGRVPRWFTEGLSVYEERRAKPTWTRNNFREFYGRVLAGKLIPIAKLNPEFTRGRVLLAYFHASWIVEFIIETQGFAKIIVMLKAYAKDKNDAQVFQEVFGVSIDEMNDRFVKWLKKRFGHFCITPLYYADEIDTLRHYTVENPKDAAGFLRLGRACLQNGKMADAEINAGRALLLDDKSAGVHGILGEIFYIKKSFDTAEKYLRRSEDLKNRNYAIFLNLANIYNGRGERKRAMAYFEKSLAAFPEYTGGDGPYHRLGALYKMAGFDDKALALMEALSLRDENSLPLRLELAKEYKKRDLQEKFVNVCRQILDIWPYRMNPKSMGGNRFDVHFELAGALMKLGRSAEALDEARMALTEAQFGEVPTEGREEVEIRLLVAETAIAQDNKEEARTQLEEIVEVLDPANEKAKKLLAALGDEDE